MKNNKTILAAALLLLAGLIQAEITKTTGPMKYQYETTNTTIKAYIKQDLNQPEPILIKKDVHTVTMKPNFKANLKIKGETPPKRNPLMIPTPIIQALKPSIQLEYEATNNKLKEQIIINQKPPGNKSLSFDFKIGRAHV